MNSLINNLKHKMPKIKISTAERELIDKQHTKRVHETDERAMLMLNSAPIGIMFVGENFEVIDCNEKVMEMFGITDINEFKANFITYSPEYQPSGERSSSARKRILKEIFSTESGSFEWMHQKPNGELLPCEISFVPLRYKGKMVSIGYISDLSETKAAAEKVREAEEQKQMLESIALREQEANQLKSRFLATMSHEIRTPMNAIIGMSELALREQTPEGKNEYVHTVKQAASNLLAIINDILDFSKIEAGKMEIVPDEYPVEALIHDVVSIIKMRVLDSQLRFAVKADCNIPDTLYGDETRIRQAVLNLLSNAVKYTEKGFVTLGIYSRIVSEDTAEITFEVTDTGIGIKPEDLDKLFTDFTQLDFERNKGVEGVGLGLAITRNIIEAMDGTISVKSEYGKGSTFTITLPQRFGKAQPLAKIDRHGEPNVIFLVYERRSANIESITYTFDNLGVDYTLVSSQGELYEKIENHAYDYLFLPYTLYKLNEDAMQKLGGRTKVVILSEFGETIDSRENVAVLTMPVYCIHIANLINGNIKNAPYQAGSGEHITFFSAPDARILVVDDIRTNLKVMEGLLTPYDVNVELCTGGLASIEAVRSERYDLIFMDHKMPGVDGMEAAGRIRALGVDTPIVALTANAISGMMEMFIENGFDDFLSKPVDTVKLNAVLDKWIPKSKRGEG